jgi:hypothetical protein
MRGGRFATGGHRAGAGVSLGGRSCAGITLGVPAPPPVDRGEDPAPLALARRRRVLIAGALAAVLAFGHSGGSKAVAVKPHSVVVIDPSKNALVRDIPVGAYPGPLAADNQFVYVSNIGDATFSRILPDKRKVYDTGSLSRAIDLAVVNKHLWAADGGVAGHTPAPPGTVMDYDLLSAHSRTIRLGPGIEGDEEQTTIAAERDGAEVWAGNKDSETVTQLEPTTRAKIHGSRRAALRRPWAGSRRQFGQASDSEQGRPHRRNRGTHRRANPDQGFPSRSPPTPGPCG